MGSHGLRYRSGKERSMGRTILALLVGGFLTFPPHASAEPEVRVDYEYYEIHGETAEALRQAMNVQGVVWKDGNTYDAFTSWNVSWTFERRLGRKGCTLQSVRTVVKVTQRFPKWKDRSYAPPDLRDRWNAYMKALKEHEDGHKDLAVRAAGEIEAFLVDLPPSPSCEDLIIRANASAMKILEKYKNLEEAYDEATGFGETQGAVFP
jgi:predicted secreted Zn-dependent protease